MFSQTQQLQCKDSTTEYHTVDDMDDYHITMCDDLQYNELPDDQHVEINSNNVPSSLIISHTEKSSKIYQCLTR